MKAAACALMVISSGAQSAEIACPPMPAAVTDQNRDVKSEISASVGSLGKVKAGEIGIKTDVTAANLFAKYPNVDRLLALQTMASTYCGLLRSSAIADSEKLDRWERFTNKLMSIQESAVTRSIPEVATPPKPATEGSGKKIPAPNPNPKPAPVTPANQRWTIQAATAVDQRTGLIWQRCAVGLTYSGNSCVGKAAQLRWPEAVKAQYDGWRLPTKDELTSIYEWRGPDRRPIDEQVFRNFDCCWYWTRTPVTSGSDAEHGWIGIFHSDSMHWSDFNVPKGAGVLLVRGPK